jgi:divalent metal cation (Fe/Co/Zn/Cd) transporter
MSVMRALMRTRLMIENLYAVTNPIDWDTFIYIGVVVALGTIISGALWVWLDDVFGGL